MSAEETHRIEKHRNKKSVKNAQLADRQNGMPSFSPANITLTVMNV